MVDAGRSRERMRSDGDREDDDSHSKDEGEAWSSVDGGDDDWREREKR